MLAACVLALSASRTAIAEPARHVDLRWEATAGCIGRDALARTVESTLGRPVFRDATGQGAPPAKKSAATIEGRVGASPSGGFRASVTLRSPSGTVLTERSVGTDAETCDRLDESVAVVVALMVDSVQEPGESPTPVTPPATTPLHVGAVGRATPRTARGAEPVPLGVSVDIGPIVTAGLLPNASFGVTARAQLELRELWSVGVSGFAWLPSQTVNGGVGARIWAWAGELGACVVPLRASAFRLGACLGVGGGATEATPIGLVEAGRTRLPLAFSGGALDAALHLGGPVWLHVRPNVWILFVNPEYSYREADGTSRRLTYAFPVVLGLSLGLGLRSGS